MDGLKRFGFVRLTENVVLLLYAALLVWVIPHHESWGDEQQAWLESRSFSFGELASTILRKEGAPGLWHGTLWLLARLHLGFGGAHFLCGVTAFAAVFVLLRCAPFPLWLRGLLPFTFYLVFQYAVVARQYVFFPLLVFIQAALLCSTRWRPYCFAVAGLLLANTSLHGWCFSLGAALILWMLRERLPIAASFAESHHNRAAAMLLLAGWGLAVCTAMPLPRSSAAHTVATPASTPTQPAPPSSIAAPQSMATATPFNIRYVPPLGMSRFQTALWNASHRRSPAGQPTAPSELLRGLILALSLATYPIASSNLLATTFLVLIFFYLRRLRALILLVPYLLIFAASLATRVFEHHTGLLFVSLIAALWISLRLKPAMPADAETPKRLVLAALLVVAVLQVAWGLHAVISDVRLPYSGSEQAARYITPLYGNERILFAQGSMVTDPPFYRRYFVPRLQPGALKDALTTEPQIVVAGEVRIGDNDLWNQWIPMHRFDYTSTPPDDRVLLQQSGYRQSHRFCGRNFMRSGYSRMQCEVIYERASNPMFRK